MDVFRTSYVHSIYVVCPGGSFNSFILFGYGPKVKVEIRAQIWKPDVVLGNTVKTDKFSCFFSPAVFYG